MRQRQAYELIQEIETKFTVRSGCMMWSWSIEHIAFLIQRWKWKTPSDIERINQVAIEIASRAKLRIQAGLSPAWLYMFRDQIQEMMIGAGMKPERIENAPAEVDESIVLLKSEAILMGIEQQEGV